MATGGLRQLLVEMLGLVAPPFGTFLHAGQFGAQVLVLFGKARSFDAELLIGLLVQALQQRLQVDGLTHRQPLQSPVAGFLPGDVAVVPSEGFEAGADGVQGLFGGLLAS